MSEIVDLHTGPDLFNVAERTEVAVKTHQALGLVADIGWSYDVVGLQMERLHNALKADWQHDAFVEPFKPVDLDENFTLSALVSAYDQLTHPDGSQVPQTSFDPKFWGRYTTKQLNQRVYRGAQQPADVVARAMLFDGDELSMPGLHHTSRKPSGQKRDSKGFIKAYNRQHPHSRAGLMNVADVMMINAQRVVEGREVLEPGKRVRILRRADEYPDQTELYGGVYSYDGQLVLTALRGFADPSIGVRFSAEPKTS